MLRKKIWPWILSATSVATPVLPASMSEPQDWISRFDDAAAITSRGSDRNSYNNLLVESLTANRLSARAKKILTDRLMKAELADTERGPSVDEQAIARAYNHLTKAIAPPNMPDTDEHRVHFIREVLSARAPHIISVARNVDKCRPDEAVFLLTVMMQDFGSETNSSFAAAGRHIYFTRPKGLSLSQTLYTDKIDAEKLSPIFAAVFASLGF